jgi:hypothetical protein
MRSRSDILGSLAPQGVSSFWKAKAKPNTPIYFRFSVSPAMTALTSPQRNIYLYFLNHKEKNPGEPCYVPASPVAHGRLHQYLRALEKLEELHLVIVDTAKVYCLAERFWDF